MGQLHVLPLKGNPPRGVSADVLRMSLILVSAASLLRAHGDSPPQGMAASIAAVLSMLADGQLAQARAALNLIHDINEMRSADPFK